MNLTPIYTTNSPYSPPTTPLQLTTRSQKTEDFFSGALPAALLGGLQGLNTSTAAAGSLAASTATAGTAVKALGTAASATSIAGGIYGALQLMANWGRSSPSAGASSGMALGATIGSCFAPGIGTAIGAGIGALAGGLIGSISSGKHKDQQVRDAVREVLVQSQILNEDYLIPLADGSMYDLGKDGGARAEFGGRRPYELDFNNPLIQHAVAWMNPIIELLSQGNQKIHIDFVGYFANAAVSNAKSLSDVKRNVDSFMTHFGLSNQTLAQAVVRLAQAGRIDQSIAQAYITGITERASLSESDSARSR